MSAEAVEGIFEGLRQQMYNTKTLDSSRLEEALTAVDDDYVDRRDLDVVLRFCGLFTSKQDLALIFNAFGGSGEGKIAKADIVDHLVPPMNVRRQHVVARAWASLAPPAEGKDQLGEDVALATFWAVCDVSGHPAARRGGGRGAVEDHFRGVFGDEANLGEGATLSWDRFAHGMRGMSAAMVVDDIFVDVVLKVSRRADRGGETARRKKNPSSSSLS